MLSGSEASLLCCVRDPSLPLSETQYALVFGGQMDVEALKQGLSAIAMALGLLKQAKDLLPDGKNKEEISENVEKAERQIKIAEAQIAQSMGYKLCRNHFPPEIMLSSDNENWVCHSCGNRFIPKQFKHPGRGISGI
jgi:hypothetical protein